MPATGILSVADCSPAASIRLKKESTAEAMAPFVRQIVGSTDKMLFVRDPTDQSYAAIGLDSIQQIAIPATTLRGAQGGKWADMPTARLIGCFLFR